MSDIDNHFYITENFNQEVMKKFADFLDANDLYIMHSRPHRSEKYVLPESPEKREELLKAIVDALNDGFYSERSCVAFLYELLRRYQPDYKEGEAEKGTGTLECVKKFLENTKKSQ